MKKIAVVAMCLTMSVSGSLVYGGMFDSIKSAATGGGSGGVAKTDIDSYFTLSQKADDLQQGSIDALSKILLNKEDVAKIERSMEAAKAITDPKEREAAINKVKEDSQAACEKAANEKESQKKLAALSDDQKKQAGGAISNLFLAVLNNKTAVDVAKNIAQKAQSNPVSVASFSSEMPKIKDGATNLPGKIEKTYTLATQLVKIAKDNKIEVPMPKSASDKAQEVDLG